MERRWLLTAIVGGFLLAMIAMAGAGAANSISFSPAAPSTTSGVSFTVTTGGGNRDFATVAVNCWDASNDLVYATVLTVEVPPKGTGTSQTIYPPASTCEANLEKLMQIGKARILASTGPFTVSSP
jgi:hypothetical protein